MKNSHLGDGGETSLIGKRVSKDDNRVEAYGTVDELNSAIGMTKSLFKEGKFDDIVPHIKKIQDDLFVVGSELATVAEKVPSHRISASDIVWLEKISDEIEKEIKPLNKFVLPGGSSIASSSHLARSICRRAERRIITLSKKEGINPEIIRYVNRLSDFLFILARLSNQRMGVEEETWGPEGILGI